MNTLDIIFLIILYLTIFIDICFLCLFAVSFFKANKKCTCLIIYKFQTFPIALLYLITKSFIFFDATPLCSIIAMLRNILFILTLSIQTISIIFTYVSTFYPLEMKQKLCVRDISLFICAYIPALISLIVQLSTHGGVEYESHGLVCLFTGVFTYYRTGLYFVLNVLYHTMLYRIKKQIQKEFDVYSETYENYNKKMNGFFAWAYTLLFMIGTIIVLTILAKVLGKNYEKIEVFERVLMLLFEAVVPVIVCLLNLLNPQQIEELKHQLLCCKKNEQIKESEGEEADMKTQLEYITDYDINKSLDLDED